MQKHFDQHSVTCNIEQNDSFDRTSSIWQCKRNIIVELADYFEIEQDFKYDYLITYDLELIQLKVNEIIGEKLKFVTQHVPLSVSITTNVPGYDKEEKFILSNNPKDITKDMFQYFDEVAATAGHLK